MPAERQWYAPVRPLMSEAAADAPGAEDGRGSSTLRIDDVAGTRWLTSPHAGKVKIAQENAAAALRCV